MNRSRTLPALAGMALMTAVVGSTGITGAYAEDFQSQGSHLRDPANARNANDPANQRNVKDPPPDFQSQGSHLNDPADARNVNRDPADARNADGNKK
jgi:hypothetical protein